MKLLVDLTQTRRPEALIERYDTVNTQFRNYSADPIAGPRCGRCNDPLHIHLWQLVDDGDVLDCAREAS